MVIEKVHGLRATSISLNDRFTILASTAFKGSVIKPRRRSSGLFVHDQNINNHQSSIDKYHPIDGQISQHFGQHAKKQAVRQRLGALRRFSSEGSLAGLRRSNSFNNLNQRHVMKRKSWRQSNGDLSRSASFINLSQGMWRGSGFRRRGGRIGFVRGRMRSRGINRQHLVNRMQRRKLTMGETVGTRGRGGLRGRGMGKGRGRGIQRQQKTTPTKEELDLQLDQYMACTKAALDKEIDNYMKNPVDLE